MSDKMREEFEDWYMRIHPHIHYMVRTPTDGYANRHAQELWGIWQAAKSVPVDVAGIISGWIGHTDDGKVFVDAAELERLRKCEKDAERYRRLVDAARAEADTHCTYPDCICPDGVSTGSCNLGLPDAAIAAEGEKE